MKELICIVCPRGCKLLVDEKTFDVTGNSCPRGAKYAINELTNPERMITSSVEIVGASERRCPVKTSKPIKKELMFEVMKVISNIVIKAPVSIGDVIVSNVLGSDVNIIATKNIKEVGDGR